MATVEKSIMLRLRNNETRVADPNDPVQHAVWQTTLKTPVTLEQGDQVKIHTCILDGSAESIINIDDEDGIDCEVGVYKFLTFYRQFQAGIAGATNTISIEPGTKSQVPDVKRYFACVQDGARANAYSVEFVTITAEHQGLDSCGECTLRFSYISGVTGLPGTYHLKIPPFHPISHERGLTLAINKLVVGNDGWNNFAPADDKEFYKKHKLQFPSNGKDKRIGIKTIQYGPLVPAGEKFSEPFIETLKFQIPSGRYTPGEISTLINNKISDLQINGESVNNPSGTAADPNAIQFAVNNPFLSTIRQMNINASTGSKELIFFPEVSNTTDQNGNLTELIDQQLRIDVAAYAANVAAPYGPAPLNKDDLFIGAEQVDLNYDPVLRKLNWSIMHFPIYVGAQAGTPAVPGVIYNADGKIASVYGGAALASLDPPEFWQKQLGFSNIILSPQDQATTFNAGVGGTVHPVKFAPVVGQTITGVFEGLDIPVPKTARFFAPEASAANPIETSLTIPIIANREFDVSARDEGFFLIEVGFKFPQMMIGGQFGDNLTNNNIQSIVGKYFTGSNNFLQDTGAGSIIYEHHGEPELLSDLSVRILLPDGSIPSTTELGPKNTIFLEIIKTQDIETPKQ